jgi:hypothetical protein
MKLRAKAVLALSCLLGFCAPAFAAISVDSAAVSQAGTTATNTLSFTIGAGADRILVVGSVVTSSSAYDAAVSVTWNGLTLSPELQTEYSNNVFQTVELWYLVAPAAGVNADLVATYASANNSVLGAIEYAGVDPLTPFGAAESATASASPLTNTLTTLYADSWLLFNCGNYDCPDTFTIDANFTDRWGLPSGGTVGIFADRVAGAQASYSGTNTYADTVSDTVIQQLVELVPLQPTPSVTPSFTVSATPTLTPSAGPPGTATPTVGASATASASPAGPSPTPAPPSGSFVSPNPFFPTRPPLDHVRFNLPAGHAAVQLSILDLNLRLRWQGSFAGASTVEWDGHDQQGSLLPSGAYLYLLAEDGQAARKGSLVLAR